MENTNTITLDGEALEVMETFTHLGSIIDKQGRSDADVKARIGKARTAFPQLKHTWNSKQLLTKIKVTIFNTNYHKNYRSRTSIYEQLSTYDTQCPLTEYYQQQPTLGEKKPASS
ncbi:unnamed protein product [Schistosoma curassoni]|uniref:DUF6451 domain-containing protein n=1 Tax=Schistosoma curassoni TaxID=6186 RepID=A0A183KAG3_9TREM|nr:unnamed protein product [Schistosoma curassoni]